MVGEAAPGELAEAIGNQELARKVGFAWVDGMVHPQEWDALCSLPLRSMNLDASVPLRPLHGAITGALETIQSSGGELSVAFAESLGPCRALWGLDLLFGKLAPGAVRSLCACSALKWTSLIGCRPLANDDLQALASMPSLRELWMSYRKEYAATLPEIAARSRLVVLQLEGSVPDDVAGAIRKAAPDLDLQVSSG